MTGKRKRGKRAARYCPPDRFFHFSDARLRPITDADRLERARIVSSAFYSYTPEQIAAWCLVPLETAQRWKRWESEPSPPELALFRLHATRRVLTSPAWDGWLVNGDKLVDPEGNATTQGQLRAYYFVYQLARALVRDDAQLQARLRELMEAAG